VHLTAIPLRPFGLAPSGCGVITNNRLQFLTIMVVV